MDLACIENLDDIRVAQRDRSIFDDDRVLENLLNNEFKYMPKFNYFSRVQTEVQPYMRKIVTTWMMEVCEEQMIEDQVFPLAVNLMDRFLSVCNIKKQQLQLLGAACLLISSKLRTSNMLTIGLLRAYTDYSVSHELIEKWEVLVLSKLQWDINGVTPFDFIDQVIQRCPWGIDNDTLRRHSHTLVTICSTEPRLIETFPSLIAAACICSAVRGLKLPSSDRAIVDICTMLKTRPARMEVLAAIIDNKVIKLSSNSKDSESLSPQYLQTETPTEVENILF
ncbi:G1/S-specific cyclin-D2-like [Anoplophora glabripennis]|uniref:G1/S-specific cyclin-D2-like n=1 Tax=Anoplophora glabripennis TaxID=217634 RepID=UPI0008758624|nr:G1/S-specific cyclin-D2-like [Anoplophora glabripennis]